MTAAILLNGLWQGALVAAIAAIVTSFVPQRHAATRYAVWFSALLALAIVPVFSFWHPVPEMNAFPSPVMRATAATAAVAGTAASASGNWLAGIWLAGVLLSLARLATSFIHVNRILSNASPALQFGADVLVSEDVAVPIAAGLFAPKVILPANLAATLEREDLDSIVRHERAHIARMDIAGNFIQRLIEALLFFNPWTYVIGRQLAREREAACDDWAVQPMSAPDRYAECLAQLAQKARRSRITLLTPSAIGPGNLVIGRIARLLNGKVTQLKVNRLVVVASVSAFAVLAIALQTANGLASLRDRSSSATQIAANTKFSPKCYHDVTVLNAAMPEIPQSAATHNLWANALVTVGADGKVLEVKIVRSSGSAAVDGATVDAAKRSTYAPEMNACKARTGQYLFHVVTGS